MTDPDPVAALAAQLEELRGQLARSQGDIGALKARMDNDVVSQTMLLRLEVKRLAEALAKAVEKRQLAPPPAPWWCVAPAEGEAMLADLRGWVETFLRPHYADYLTGIPACVLAHPAAVWELSTLRAEWDRIFADADNRDLAGSLAWHDRYLPGVLTRLKAVIRCDESGCLRTRRGPGT
jgi:hypothetical protein